MRYKCAVLTPWKVHVMQLWVSITGSSGSWRMCLAWALRRPVEIANLGTISDCAGPEPTDVIIVGVKMQQEHCVPLGRFDTEVCIQCASSSC